MIQTKQSILWKIYSRLWINKKFCHFSESIIDYSKDIFISPCDAKIQFQWDINNEWKLIWKHGKTVCLQRIYWDKTKSFKWYSYLSLYLSPANRHFFVAPESWKITYINWHNWDAKIPYVMALEKYWIPVFREYIEHNAAMWYTIKTEFTKLWMIALWSLNVNHIVSDYSIWDTIQRWQKIGHFLMGSGIILLYPSHREAIKKVWDAVNIWEWIIKKNRE